MCDDHPINFTGPEKGQKKPLSKKEIRSRMFKIICDQIGVTLKNLFLTIFFVCGLACVSSSILIFIVDNANRHVVFFVHTGSIIAIIGGLGFWLYRVYIQAKSGE